MTDIFTLIIPRVLHFAFGRNDASRASAVLAPVFGLPFLSARGVIQTTRPDRRAPT